MPNNLKTNCHVSLWSRFWTNSWSYIYVVELHPRYLEELEVTFTTTENPHCHMYQAPLLYNWKLDELCSVTRVTAILRSALMMGALIPFNINTMSIYSFSGKLLKEGDFIHPGKLYSDTSLFYSIHILPQITCYG